MQSRFNPNALFCAAVIFNLTSRPFPELPVLDLCLIGLSALCFYLPLGRGFILLPLMTLVRLVWFFPQLGNHEILLGFLALLHLVEPNTKLRLRSSQVILATTYLVAMIHKLNDSFFDVEKSCISFFFQSTELPVPLLAGLTVLLELAVGVLIFIGSDRSLGVAGVMGVLFHGALAFLGFRDFAAVAAALFFRSEERANLAAKLTLGVHFVLFFCRSHLSYFWSNLLLGISLLCTILFIAKFPIRLTNMTMGKRGKAMCASIVLLGTGPYWGGGHFPSFSMFSNLEVHHDYSNSWLVDRPQTAEDGWWLVEGEGPVRGLPYFGNFLLRDKIYFKVHERHLFAEEREGNLLLHKDGVSRRWPMDFPLEKRPPTWERLFLNRRFMALGRCQW